MDGAYCDGCRRARCECPEETTYPDSVQVVRLGQRLGKAQQELRELEAEHAVTRQSLADSRQQLESLARQREAHASGSVRLKNIWTRPE